MSSPDGRRPGAAIAGAAILALAVPGIVLAADPSPTSAAAGDPRSAGQGPGLVGDPLWAIAVVVVIAVTALLVTLAWVRLTRGPGEPSA